MFISLYVAEIMHGVHSGSVPTLMLAVFKHVKTLIFSNIHRVHSTCVVYRILKQNSGNHTTKLCNDALAHVYVTEIMRGMHLGRVPTSILVEFKLVNT